MSVFSNPVKRIGYFCPIGRGGGGDTDYRIELMNEHSVLDDTDNEMFRIEEDKAWHLITGYVHDKVQILFCCL